MLPPEKKDKLSEKVADEVEKIFRDKEREVRTHEVNNADSYDIVRKGVEKGLERFNNKETP